MKCQIAACNVLAKAAIAKDQSKLLGYLKPVSLIENSVILLTTVLEWLDVVAAVFIGSFQGYQGCQLEPGLFGTMQAQFKLEPASENDVVSDSQIHRVQLPALREDLRFIWETSNLDGVLDTILSADIPLCMAPKCGMYDLSVYEVRPHLLIHDISHTDPKTIFSVFVGVSAPAYRCCVAQTKAPWTRRTRMTTELCTWLSDFSVN